MTLIKIYFVVKLVLAIMYVVTGIIFTIDFYKRCKRLRKDPLRFFCMIWIAPLISIDLLAKEMEK